MIHYIYRIDFLCGEPGRYYLGKRSYHGEVVKNDKYAGSGNFCFAYYKKYGKILGTTYTKQIIEINNSKKINNDREQIIVGDLWKTDPLCMNQCPGGMGYSKHDKNRYKPVIQYNLDGTVVRVYDSIVTANAITGIWNIVSCCRGKSNSKTAGGYIWRYKGDPFDIHYVPEMRCGHPESRKKINQYTIDGKYIKTWNSLKEAAKYYSDSPRGNDWLSEAVDGKDANSWYGFVWRTYNGSTDDIVVTARIARHKKIGQYSKDGELIAVYRSCLQAAKALGRNSGANIHKCVNNTKRYKTCLGYIWKYIE